MYTPPFADTHTAKVTAGDWLAFTEQDVDYSLTEERELACRVLAIVPPDAKSGVVGWVELSYPPVPTSDLGAKARVVRATKQ